ncbi:hypothetical protein GCM10020229_12500 [Kitasatospora albolonga]|uniref:SDR family oxidoreductase n=1 Tax=Kitasatospora albolonga TaxID=68173 RepID=UPI0031E91921
MTGLTRSLAKELGPRGIRVNVVAPGVIENRGLRGHAADRAEGRCGHLLRRRPSLARLGTVAELAAPVLFLLSDLSGYVHRRDPQRGRGHLMASRCSG